MTADGSGIPCQVDLPDGSDSANPPKKCCGGDEYEPSVQCCDNSEIKDKYEMRIHSEKGYSKTGHAYISLKNLDTNVVETYGTRKKPDPNHTCPADKGKNKGVYRNYEKDRNILTAIEKC